MIRTMRYALFVCVFAVMGLAVSSCGGGGSSESVVPGRLTISNNCSTGTYAVTVNNASWGSVAPGAAVTNDVPPGVYNSVACLPGTATCKSDSSAISSREHLTLYICP